MTYKHNVLPVISQWFLACTPYYLAPKNGLREALPGGHPAGHAVHLGWGLRSLAAPQLDQWDSHGIPMGFQWDSHGIPMGFLWVSHGIPMGFQRIDVNCFFFFSESLGRSWDTWCGSLYCWDPHFYGSIVYGVWTQKTFQSQYFFNLAQSQLFHGPIFHMFPPFLGCLRVLDSHVLLWRRTPLRAEVHLSGRAAYHQHHSATWLKGRFAVQETLKHGGVSTIENGDVN